MWFLTNNFITQNPPLKLCFPLRFLKKKFPRNKANTGGGGGLARKSDMMLQFQGKTLPSARPKRNKGTGCPSAVP